MLKVKNMGRWLWMAAVVLTVACSGLMASGKRMNLPTAKVGGQEMYYYEWHRGDNLYSVARFLGVTRDQIVANNPSAADGGLRPGDRIYFPCDPSDLPPASVSVSPDGPTSCIVRKGDTFYSIARQYGLHVDSLQALNPQTAGRPIKVGERLWLRPQPQGGEMAAVGAQAPAERAEGEAVESRRDLEAGGEAEVPAGGDYVAEAEPTAQPVPEPRPEAEAEELNTDTLEVAVLLPFMLSEPEQSRTTRLFTEFFRGLMMATDTLASQPGVPVRFRAFDTAANADTLRRLLTRPEVTDVDMVVAPSEAGQLEMIVNAVPGDTRVINVFGVKDSTYLSNPNELQTNIPQAAMYDKAIQAFLDQNEGRQTVFLQRTGGAADKERFTTMLRLALARAGRPWKDVNFSSTLYVDDLRELQPDSVPVVFVPNSGSKAEFAKISRALELLLERSGTYDGVTVWGYPEWVTFRGDAFDDICSLNATIYSRFMADEHDPQARALRGLYSRRYGEEMFDAVPSQGLLGFDMGRYMVEAVRQEYASGQLPAEFSGVQSALKLKAPVEAELTEVEADGTAAVAGDVNDALFIIRYRPGGTVTKTVR